MARLFSQWFDLAPRPSPHPPLPSVNSTCDTRKDRERKRDKLPTGEGEEGMDEEPNHTTARKLPPAFSPFSLLSTWQGEALSNIDWQRVWGEGSSYDGRKCEFFLFILVQGLF
jgi:hypothetical protein